MSMSPRGSGFPGRSWWAGLMLLGLAACRTSPAPTPAPAPPASIDQAGIPADAREYRVVPGESLLQILVYRGGPMARLGHNHVIASHHLHGTVHFTDDLWRTRFDIRIPVNELTVDEPAMRETAGADFPPDVPQSARDGTHRNLLSEALLDGANYPEIRLRAIDVTPGADPLDVGIEIEFKGVAYPLRVPVLLDHEPGALIARGEFALKQSELGLKPFSAAMGALLVLDEMKIRFEISARAAPMP